MPDFDDAIRNAQEWIALVPELVALAQQYRNDLRHGVPDDDARQRRLDAITVVLSRVEQQQTRNRRFTDFDAVGGERNVGD